MINSDYRLTQDAPQRDRSAILHGSGGQHPTAQPNQYATPLHITLHRAALEEKQQQPDLPFDPHPTQYQHRGRMPYKAALPSFQWDGTASARPTGGRVLDGVVKLPRMVWWTTSNWLQTYQIGLPAG